MAVSLHVDAGWRDNGPVNRRSSPPRSVDAIRELARSGELRAAADAARAALREPALHRPMEDVVELHLVDASCAMRQGHHDEALASIDAARAAARRARRPREASAHVDVWAAELASFQGRYSEANRMIDLALGALEHAGDLAYLAFAMRVRIAILLARTDYEAIGALADGALQAAHASGDAYVTVQVLNILGAVRFDLATSKLPEPHARAHLSSLDPGDAAPMEEDARAALRYFEEARDVAQRAGYLFAAWYVQGNIERLQILLGRANDAARAIRKRLAALQERGATHDEIVARSNLAWALRCLGRHREALHELDAALRLTRSTGTFNVLLEFLHYDRSVVLDALGDIAAARSSYRRYLRLVGGRSGGQAPERAPSVATKRPLEPFFLKRADRFIGEHLDAPVGVERVAQHCGVSWRTLQKAFTHFRGMTVVAYVRNLRLDRARQALEQDQCGVAEAAARYGFGSATTFSLEYRKRFGMAPSRAREAGARTRAEAPSKDASA